MIHFFTIRIKATAKEVSEFAKELLGNSNLVGKIFMSLIVVSYSIGIFFITLMTKEEALD